MSQAIPIIPDPFSGAAAAPPVQPAATETIELLSPGVTPRQLFVLLHDAGGTAADMLELGGLLGDAFAQAAVLIPEGFSGPHADAAGAAASGQDDAAALALRVEALAAFVRLQQQRFDVLQSDTALAGLGAGASLALALSDAHDGLVGRLLSFGGGYQIWPARAPALTTLHLLHGQNDRVVPVARTRRDFEHLMELGADATLDVAATLGHELHPALMDQAVNRLQTCVPLRHWRAA
ncbi:MAG: esterase [Polaromonas sp.]|nr:esterase [Polaromonas sp.]